MKTRILAVIIFLISYSATAQFQEVPTPSTNALYSGCTTYEQSGLYVWVCRANGAVFKGRSDYPTLTWINASGNLTTTINLISISAIDSMTVFAAGNTQSTANVYKSTNGGANWVQQLSQTGGTMNAVWMRNASTGILVGNPVGGRWSIWQTTNGGAVWDSSGRYLAAGLGETGYRNSFWCIGDTVMMGTNNSKIYFSSNYGANWSSRSTAPETNIYSLYWDLIPPAALSAGSASGMLQSSDLGESWIDSQNVQGTGNIYGICSSTPGADHSEYINMYTRSNKIYWGYYSGYWNLGYTAPSGNYTFMFQKRNEPPPPYQMIGPIVAVRDNGGVSICSDCRAGAVRRIGTEVPRTFSLSQNYPNPFNPTTRIHFDVLSSAAHQKAHVKIAIFDVLGREVAVPVNESLSSGTYETDWDASEFSSGVYFYSLISDDFVQTKKMILIK